VPDYNFNPKTRQYSQGKKTIPRSQIRGWIREANDAQRKRLEKIGKAFTSGTINRSEAEIRAMLEITKHNSAVAVIANGGREQMDARAWGRASGPVKSERSFLRELFLSYDRGDVSKEKLATRLSNYADAGERTYTNLFRDYAKDAGLTREKNLLGASERSCSECPGLSAQGEVAIGSLPGVGSRVCGPGCNCSIVIKGVDY
jgi:hypothetical protein